MQIEACIAMILQNSELYFFTFEILSSLFHKSVLFLTKKMFPEKPAYSYYNRKINSFSAAESNNNESEVTSLAFAVQSCVDFAAFFWNLFGTEIDL